MRCVSVFLLVISAILLTGCKTKEIVAEATNSTKALHIEKVDGVSVSSSDTRQWHWGERIYSVVLNEKGDTVKEKEYVRVSDKMSEVYKDSVSRQREIIDSLMSVKSQYIRYTVTEKHPWWKDYLMWFSVIVSLLLLATLTIYVVYHRTHKREAYE